ncbi:MAG: PorP/SprF family type IX secretion system membrane protein [Flavobacteriaceae bacterium]|nr:PorP/SprF family type IX secretion system membrane protein [Flavobacteriaceae bacterium]
MKKYLLHIVIFFCLAQTLYSQEDGVVAFALPVRNSLKFNKYAINPTFSFVREQNKYISFSNKREWVQFDNAPQTYLFSYSGRFAENVGAGLGLFQQNYGVLTTFGGVMNVAYNAVLDRDSNLTFGMNVVFYKSGIKQGSVITNFPDPSLDNVPSNSILTVNPGINYGTTFFDLGISLNNIVSYNLKTNKIIEENPEQSIQAHLMYTGYMNSAGFFDESKFSGLVRSEFKKDKTIISGIVMLTIPKGMWTQVGYNSLYGASAGMGFNITNQICLEYNYEKAIGDLSSFGSSHEITLAYKFNRIFKYDYSDDDVEGALITPTKKGRKSVAKQNSTGKTDAYFRANRIANAQAKADEAARLKTVADAKAKADEEAKIKAAQEAKAKADEAAKLKAVAETQVKADEETKIKAAQDAKAKADEATRLKAVAEAKAVEEAKIKLAQEAKAKADEAAKLKAVADAKVKADEAARLKAVSDAKAKADEAARLKAVADAKAKADEEAKIKSAQEAKIKADEAARLKAVADAKAKADEEAKIKSAQEAKAKAEETARLKAIADAKAKADEEAKIKVAQEAKAKADETARLKAVAEAKAKADEEAKIKTEELDGVLVNVPKDANSMAINDLTKLATDSNLEQQKLLLKLKETIASRDKDLKDLKEENDLSEQGIFKEPKPFKSVSAENAEIESLNSQIDIEINEQDLKIKELEKLYDERLKKAPKEDSISMIYLNEIEIIKKAQSNAKRTKASLVSQLEEIKIATEIERKRRIKRAAYDNEEARYLKDRAALNVIKQNTPVSTVPLKVEDFDFGEEQSNIQIVKDIKNVESGYYMVIAVHSDVEKRDEFLRKAVASGQTDVDFFYDVNTSKYYIFYQKYDYIDEANRALNSKENKPYNSKMSMVKIEN